MADDSESDRPSSDADESEDHPSDGTETPESSDARTEEASASSDDTESGGFEFGGDGESEATDDASEDADDPTEDAGDTADDTDAAAGDSGDSDEDADGSSEAAADSSDAVGDDAPDGSSDGDADSDSDPDSDANEEDDADDADEEDDDVDYVTLEREGLVDPPEESDADAPETISDAAETSPDEDAETDADGEMDAENLWPEEDRPEGRAAEKRRETVADTDGGAPANPTVGESEPQPAADVTDDGMFGDGPESDQEMPLADHIEEMVNRLAAVFLVGGLVTLVLYPGADLANSALNLNFVSSTEVINFLWNEHIPGAPEIAERRPRVYGPLELVLTELKVAGLAGLVVGLPVFVYETYLFMRPGLFPRERRYYLAAVPTSLVLAFIGIAFAHFLVLPAIFAYFTSYTQGTAVVAFGLKETFNLILILMGYNAIIFQIPLFIMLAIMMNLVTREWLVARRLIFWASFLGVAFLVSPDPTGMAPIIIAATMITLFEGTLFLLRWTGRGSLAPTAEGLAAYRPQAAVLAALVGYLLSPLPAPTGYYDLLPSVVVETLSANGLAVYTPLFIAGALIGVFELVSLLLRRYGRSRRLLRVRLAIDTARRSVWLVAVVVGYLGSPDPAVLRWAAGPNLHPALAGGIAVGLMLGYEALRLLLASRENRAA